MRLTATILDHSVFPDLDVLPVSLETDAERADYIARICGAWDFGIPPLRETIELCRRWRSAFDRFPLVDSPAYAALRSLYGWPPIGGGHVQRAHYELVDARNDAPADVCAGRW